MSTPITHESSEHALAEDAEVRDQSERRRQIIGLFVGLALAALVYLIFPESSVDVVSSADSKGSYTHGALRITAAIAVLMGAWWMTEAIPLAATALVPLVAFPCCRSLSFLRSRHRMPRQRFSCSWVGLSWRSGCSVGICIVVWL